MGAASCSAAAASDLPGEHRAAAAEAAVAEVTCIFDEDALIKAAGSSVVSLGETAALPDSSHSIASEAAAGTEIEAAAPVLLSEATKAPASVHADTAEEHAAGASCSSSALPTPGSADEPVTAAPSTAASASAAASMSTTNPDEEPVPPILILARHLQAEKRAVKDTAPSCEMKEVASGPPEASGLPEGVQMAFLNAMASGTEGHQYDQAEITRVAKELESMTDPRAFYTKPDDADSTDIAHSKKKAVQKQAGAASSQSKGTKKAVTKDAGGSKSAPKRKERLPGCSVKSELAKHMTQEELDDHEERRERWVKSEMQKAKKREDINRRMHAACHQQ